MILFKSASDLNSYLETRRNTGTHINFVPTMGALHQGHLTLVKEAKKDQSLIVVSIFINPTQFNDPNDYKKYPVTIDKDIEQLEAAGCDVLFLPAVNEIYPHGVVASKPYDLGYLETILEGKYRPGHFQGVCTVVDKLLTIVQPDNLFMGQKDYQQCMVIQRLLEIIDPQPPVRLHISPTTREITGLAMSSRNVRLSENEKVKAVAISRELQLIKEKIEHYALSVLKAEAIASLEVEGFKVDYLEAATANDLQIVDQYVPGHALVLLTAAYLGDVRLIDNVLINR